MKQKIKTSILTLPPKNGGQSLKKSIIGTIHFYEPEDDEYYDAEFLSLNFMYILQELEGKGYRLNENEIEKMIAQHERLIENGYVSYIGIMADFKTSYTFTGNSIYKGKKLYGKTVDAIAISE